MTDKTPTNAPQPPRFLVGQSAELTNTWTADDVALFAKVTGDTNPVHLDEAYAAQSRFGQRIAHGMLSAGLVSAVLGTKLPGPGAIYISQTLKFLAPVFLGDTVTARVQVAAVREDKPIVTFETSCRKQDGTVVVEGQAVLFVPPAKP
ncbi:MAG: MaoC family dehydratase [Myxococcota bacterium]